MWPSGLTFAMTLTLNFQGQIWSWIYLYQKWSDCDETKSKHIDWTLGLKCDQQILPRPWPWPWLFKVKYEICYIATKRGLIAAKRKANISIWTLGLKCDNGFDFGHYLDIWIFKVICNLDHLVTKVRCKDLPDSDRSDFRCRRAVDSPSYLWELPHFDSNFTEISNQQSSNGSRNGMVPNKPKWGNRLRPYSSGLLH